MKRRDFLQTVCWTTAAFSLARSATAQEPNIMRDEVMVPSSDPGIEIFVRNKRLANMAAFSPGRTLLFVHGATYPASSAFDLVLDGVSWMDYIASRGFDVYLLDLRGYGRSTRPKEMVQKPEANPPIVRGDVAVGDIGTVVDFILKRRGIPRLNLMGWSWGTTLMATYTTGHDEKVERLMLYAPVSFALHRRWCRPRPGPLGAYRTVTREVASNAGIPASQKTRRPRSFRLVPLHRGSDRLNVVHRRSGRCSGSTSNSMLRAILGFLLMNPARSSVNTIW